MGSTSALKVSTPSDREIILTRVFNAPRHLVFEAFTKPELLQRWLLGPPGWAMVICEVDLRVGGAYRYLWRHSSGRELGMHGVYREISPPGRLVCTELMEGFPSESVVSSEFVEQGGKTTFTASVLYASREVRDTVIKSGMERGAGASYDRLEELLQAGSSASA